MRAALLLAVVCAACGPPARAPVAPGPTGYYQRSQPPARPSAQPPAPGQIYETGKATWYGGKLDGGPTASGERFNQNALTAAHKHLPMNTLVRVRNLENGRDVVVRINDRGPYGAGRIIDVSFAAAKQLGMVEAGVVPVELVVVELGEGRKKHHH